MLHSFVTSTETNGGRYDPKSQACRMSDCLSAEQDLTQASRSHAVIAWGGDVNLGRRLHYRTASLKGPSLDIVEMRAADLTLVNLECVVSRRGRMGVKKGEEAPYYFHARPEMLRILQDAGVDAVVTANNHSGDYGGEALVDQQQWLARAGIGFVGSGLNTRQAFAPIFRNAGPYVVEIFAVDTTQRRTAAGTATPGQAYLPSADLQQWTQPLAGPIAQARNFADVVLVAVHAGRNFATAPGPEDIAVSRWLIDAGADAVLGSSAHVVQGVEIYKGKPIIHDAGDLLFDAVVREDKDGGLFLLKLGAQGIEQVRYVPLRIEFGYTLRLTGADAVDVCQRFVDKSAALGSAFRIDGDHAVLDIRCDDGGSPRAHFYRVPAQAVPEPEWTVPVVPQDAQFKSPYRLGPLRLLGLRVSPAALDRRGLLYVESFWAADEPLRENWRIEVRALARGSDEPPMVWGSDSEHDPCDWMMPTTQWQPGVIYRDFYGLRPPSRERIRNANLDVVVRVVGEGRRHAWQVLPLSLEFKAQGQRANA